MLTKEDRHATPHRATVSPPGPDNPTRPVRLIDLWEKLPALTRRETLTTLTRLVAQRLRAPRAEPEVPHEDR